MAKIYLSSTYSDLNECREKVYDALRSVGHDVINMEHYTADNRRPLQKCLDDVAACDLYVGIFAWRYGYVPQNDNPEQKAITELEFRHAVANGKACLIFLLDKKAPWPYELIEHGGGAEKLNKLREEFERDYTISRFQTCEQLATNVIAAVANWNKQTQASTATVAAQAPARLTSNRISISRLPITGKELFGRDEQLRQLDEAWRGHATHVLSLVAWGGVGKSALINYWLGQMALEDYRDASRVYAWSFYSQGTSDKAVSADQFIEAALVWFGDTDPNRGSPWDKGERLAHLVGEQRALLVLDGLEPLQYPPGPDEGRLKDQALQSLLRQLAANNKGLCIISTRVAVADLSPFEGHTATRIDLENLSSKAGAQVLRAQGVKGPQAELEQAAIEFEGHSLALTLLGSYLSDVHGGDVAHRGEVKGLEEDERHGRHAQKVMTSYEKWFGEGPELAVLNILGLFNRPADKKAVDAVRAAPAIKGLTDKLRPLSEHKWQQVLSRLRRAKLLAEKDPNQTETLDAHPLVREHFGQKLKQERPAAWKGGNRRLYNYYKKIAKVFPDTIEEMAPLYAAVAHGCEAGLHEEVLIDVYSKRIRRLNEAFSIKKLGAYSANLATLINFFNSPWQPVNGLTDEAKGFILGEAGFCLRALGRLAEATEPMEASLEIHISQQHWKNAAISSGNLRELCLTLGKLHEALTYSHQSIELADRSGDNSERMISRGGMADVLHQMGRILEAEAKFREAEEMQEKIEPGKSFIYSLGSFWFCDLLLDKGQYDKVLERAHHTIEFVKTGGWLLDTALDQLSLGRAYLSKCLHQKTRDYTQATNYINEAVNGLRLAGNLDHLPRGLLARAELARVKGEFGSARDDLREAMEIITRGDMELYKADCHLEYARLYLAQGEKEKARESWAKAREMIEEMGYHRRDKDVREIEDLLTGATGERES